MGTLGTHGMMRQHVHDASNEEALHSATPWKRKRLVLHNGLKRFPKPRYEGIVLLQEKPYSIIQNPLVG